MSKDNDMDIPIEIRPYLDEIAERLWSGHGVVMVGSGFSKNARKTIETAPEFPDSSELRGVFYRKLYGEDPPASACDISPLPLKLADKVQATFGRPALDQLLKSNIPDEEHEPSDLHRRHPRESEPTRPRRRNPYRPVLGVLG